MKNYFERLEKIIKTKKETKKEQQPSATVTARIRFMILDVIDLRKNSWVPRRKDNNPRRIEEIRKEAEEEQARIDAEIARNQQLDKGKQGGQKGSQQGGQGQKQYQHSLKSTSMDSDTFRASKTANGNMVNKIKDVKTITTKTSNAELTLGPGGGSGFATGFAWNKPKVIDTSSSTTSGATTSSGSSYGLKPSSTFGSAYTFGNKGTNKWPSL
jgi:translation initiation factor 4G